jgi:hypothetical protein
MEEGGQRQIYAAKIRRILVKKTRWLDYVRPINLTAIREGREEGIDPSAVHIQCTYYLLGRPGSKQFKYGHTDPVVVKLENIEGPLNLTKVGDGDNAYYTACAQSWSLLHEARKGHTHFGQ